jgi:hypothetical protein
MRPAIVTIVAAICGLSATVISASAQQYRGGRSGGNAWVSTEHYFGAAGCHPHCGDNDGDNLFFQEKYPEYVDTSKVTFLCHGNGHTGDPCVFDSMTYTVNTEKHILNVTFRNRSDEVWVRLQAPIFPQQASQKSK